MWQSTSPGSRTGPLPSSSSTSPSRRRARACARPPRSRPPRRGRTRPRRRRPRRAPRRAAARRDRAGVASCARSRTSRRARAARPAHVRRHAPARHRRLEAVPRCRGDRLVVARVDVAQDARARVGREHPLEPLRRLVGAVGDDDHARVDRVADADAAAVVDADPGRARRDVEQRVQDRPVGDRVGAVAHRLRLAVRRGDRAGVEVVAPDHDRRRAPRPLRTSSLIASPARARSP